MKEFGKIAISLVRYALMILAANLVEKGIFDQETADSVLGPLTSLVVGVLIAIVTVGWRWLNIRFNLEAFRRALLSRSGVSEEKVIQETKESTPLSLSI